MNLTLKDSQGNAVGEMAVGFDLLEGGRGTQAVHDAVVAYNNRQRMGTACTKTVGDVTGTNKKPWRQKGTGRARAGSFASPLWRGGGVVFGPKPRDFGGVISRNTRKLALRKALSARLKAGDVTAVDEFTLAAPKTKEFVKVLAALQITGSVLVVTGSADSKVMLAARNLQGVTITTGMEVNAYDILRSNKIVVTRAALDAVAKRLAQDPA